ncbi:PIG-L family deacetylase [Gordonia humi]|uniref:N-acetyl-1-D-myo-inositol-2-amino-2-deoxy-alpha-D-glucopyranoside deacetylase n=1 Tax=Gordonia humi TaxID=686429 RepID=A0A840F3B3_9ACTN|nr:PIG-L family deacetylase [Gordonia humi]MBB4136416.1 N-acetyl-1-D-myo-inositol-2-amino-2-deoxy-alpha-D-glucopyranoside deacetylase [Gordonia humi]
MTSVSGIARAVFVHAHPDDESLWTGGAVATHIAGGGDADLITATWAPGTHRHDELLDAAAALGLPRPPITLGYADSMVPESAPDAPSLLDVPFDEQVGVLVEQFRTLRPDVVVTYDAFGMYGHPDHIHVNRLVCAAADAAPLVHYRPDTGDPWQVRSLYFATIPVSTVTLLRPHLPDERHLPIIGTPDDDIDVTVDVRAQIGAKIRAITSHRTEMKRSASMRNFASLPSDEQRLFLGWESYLRRDLVPGGARLAE